MLTRIVLDTSQSVCPWYTNIIPINVLHSPAVRLGGQLAELYIVCHMRWTLGDREYQGVEVFLLHMYLSVYLPIVKVCAYVLPQSRTSTLSEKDWKCARLCTVGDLDWAVTHIAYRQWVDLVNIIIHVPYTWLSTSVLFPFQNSSHQTLQNLNKDYTLLCTFQSCLIIIW